MVGAGRCATGQTLPSGMSTLGPLQSTPEDRTKKALSNFQSTALWSRTQPLPNKSGGARLDKAPTDDGALSSPLQRSLQLANQILSRHPAVTAAEQARDESAASPNGAFPLSFLLLSPLLLPPPLSLLPSPSSLLPPPSSLPPLAPTLASLSLTVPRARFPRIFTERKKVTVFASKAAREEYFSRMPLEERIAADSLR